MYKMYNSVQNYSWGSRTDLTELYGIANPDNLPMAELWMGAHPKSSSTVVGSNGAHHSLHDLIGQDINRYLGEVVAKRFGELPFLFKVLCAEQPLSIQVHPSKAAAERGFYLEEQRDIALGASNRNYQDANHKPELVYALTPFLALNGFREFDQIVTLLHPITEAHPAIQNFVNQPDVEQLEALFAILLGMSGEQKAHALGILNSYVDTQTCVPWQTIAHIRAFYPHDAGLFCPLLLNLVALQPGQAMFLFAETPHAYLQGVALEVMANSDNVLRAGLTHKHIDISELMANLSFTPHHEHDLIMAPESIGNMDMFPIPVPDFAFSLHTVTSDLDTLSQDSAAIIFCIDGCAELSTSGEMLILSPGESAFIPANESYLTVRGEGHIARVFNTL